MTIPAVSNMISYVRSFVSASNWAYFLPYTDLFLLLTRVLIETSEAGSISCRYLGLETGQPNVVLNVHEEFFIQGKSQMFGGGGGGEVT